MHWCDKMRVRSGAGRGERERREREREREREVLCVYLIGGGILVLSGFRL